MASSWVRELDEEMFDGMFIRDLEGIGSHNSLDAFQIHHEPRIDLISRKEMCESLTVMPLVLLALLKPDDPRYWKYKGQEVKTGSNAPVETSKWKSVDSKPEIDLQPETTAEIDETRSTVRFPVRSQVNTAMLRRTICQQKIFNKRSEKSSTARDKIKEDKESEKSSAVYGEIKADKAIGNPHRFCSSLVKKMPYNEKVTSWLHGDSNSSKADVESVSSKSSHSRGIVMNVRVVSAQKESPESPAASEPNREDTPTAKEEKKEESLLAKAVDKMVPTGSEDPAPKEAEEISPASPVKSVHASPTPSVNDEFFARSKTSSPNCTKQEFIKNSGTPSPAKSIEEIVPAQRETFTSSIVVTIPPSFTQPEKNSSLLPSMVSSFQVNPQINPPLPLLPIPQRYPPRMTYPPQYSQPMLRNPYYQLPPQFHPNMYLPNIYPFPFMNEVRVSAPPGFNVSHKMTWDGNPNRGFPNEKQAQYTYNAGQVAEARTPQVMPVPQTNSIVAPAISSPESSSAPADVPAGDDGLVVLLENLSPQIAQNELRDLLMGFGKILYIRMLRKASSCSAIVRVADHETANWIVSLLDEVALEGTSAILPYVPVIAKSLGISATVTGLLFACLPLTSVGIVAVVSGLADRFRIHKSLLIATLTITAISVLTLQFIPHISASNISSREASLSQRCSSREKLLSGTVCGFGSSNGSSHQSGISVCYLCCERNFTYTFRIAERISNIIPGDAMEPVILTDEGCVEFSMNLTSEQCEVKEKSINCSVSCTASSGEVSDGDVLKSVSFWMFTLCISVCFCGGQVIFTFLDTVAYSLLGDKRHMFGRQRLWAGIGWVTVSIANGQVVDMISEGKDRFDYGPSCYILAAFYLVAILTSALTPWKASVKPKNIAGNLRTLFFDPRVVTLIVTATSTGALASILGNFLFWYLEELESSRLLLGLCLAMNGLAEVTVFVFSGKITAKIGFVNTISLVFVAYSLRFLGLSLIDNLLWALPIETLHGFTFALFYHCLTSLASSYASPGMAATTQSILGGSYRQIGFAVGSVSGGLLFKSFGGKYTFRYLSFLSLALGVLHFVVQKILARTATSAPSTNTEAASSANGKSDNRWTEGDVKTLDSDVILPLKPAQDTTEISLKV